MQLQTDASLVHIEIIQGLNSAVADILIIIIVLFLWCRKVVTSEALAAGHITVNCMHGRLFQSHRPAVVKEQLPRRARPDD